MRRRSCPSRARPRDAVTSGHAGTRTAESPHPRVDLAAERRMAAYAAQQAAVADIGRAALEGLGGEALLEQAVTLVAETLEADFADILEREGDRLRMRAGAGWPRQAIRDFAFEALPTTRAGYALLTNAPVIVDDRAAERRFRGPSLYEEHRVVGGVSVVIPGAALPFGVLSVHAVERRRFSHDEVHFLQSVAHVLAASLERERTARVLRENEERLRRVVTGAPIALLAFDREGSLALAEGKGLEILRLLPRDMVGRPLDEVAAHLPGLQDQVRRALAGVAVEGLLESDGHAFELRSAPLLESDDTVRGAICVATDVTDRVRVERQRRAQYRVTGILAQADTLEEAAPKLLPVLGTGLGWDAAFFWVPAPGGPRRVAAWHEPSALASRQAEPSAPTAAAHAASKSARADGPPRPTWAVLPASLAAPFRTVVALPLIVGEESMGLVELYSVEVRDPDEDQINVLTAVSGQLHLFLDRRRALDQFRRLTVELERRVFDRTAQLERANRELEAFSYSVSHDLRAPLRTIDGFSKAILEDHGDVMPLEAHRLFDRIRAASQRMGTLIDDLLELARVSRGELRWTSVDLTQVARELTQQFQGQDPDRRAEFDIEPGLRAEGDPDLLALAVENLLRNAWKFTRRREVARITFGRLRQDREAVFFVKDNGAGFNPEFAHKLFVPFQRLHSPADFEGSGVGLATVLRIIQRHGGRIWAEGAIDQGATFYFALPRAPAASPDGTAHAAPATAGPSG